MGNQSPLLFTDMERNTDTNSQEMKEILRELGSSEFVSIPLLYRLSDLSSDELGDFCGAWTSIDPERRRVIVRHLADISEENFHVDFTEVFAHCLEDGSPDVRIASLAGLWDSDRVSLIGRLIDLMENDPDQEVRALAAATLGHYVVLGEWGQIPTHIIDPIVESLLNQIDDEQAGFTIRNAALESVAASGHPRVESLIYDAYDGADLAAQMSALFAMGRSADPRWIDIIIDEMSSPLVEMRLEAARAAGEIGEKSAIPELIELTSDDDLEVQIVAVSAMGLIGGDVAQRFLLDILDDPDNQELFEAASDALEEIE